MGIKDVGTQGANRLVLALNNGPNQWVGTGRSTKKGVGIAPNPETPDYYEFKLGPGQRATLALNEFGGNVNLDLRDSAGNPVVVTRPAASNVDDVLEFAGFAGLPGEADRTYYAAVLNGVTRAQYTLVVTRGAYFELEPNSGPAPWNGVDPVQTVALTNSSAVVLGSIGGASGAEAVVGYFTDYNAGTTAPESAILAAGFLPVRISDISTFDFSTIDVLMVNESNNSGLSPEMQGRLGDIQSWVALGGVFIVHDRFVTNDTGDPKSNPFLVGAPGIRLDRDFTDDADIDVIRSDTLVTDGPGGVVNNTTLDGGNSSNHGFALEETLPAGAVSILSTGPVRTPNHLAAFSYEWGNGAVYYSTIPLDFYLGGSNNFDDIYAPNALAYTHSLAVPEVDFYRVVVPVLTFGGQLEVSTLTPGDGPGEPSQFLLDPMVRVYDATGNLLAGNDNAVTGGRNALLHYVLSPALVPRTYYIQVAASDATVGPARGEYVATIALNPAPPPPGITINKASIVTGEPNLSDSFTVVLNKAPTASVSIGISSSKTTEGTVSPTSLTFTTGNWSTPQVVTVTGVDDPVDDGDIAYTIITAAAVSDDPAYDPDPADPLVGLNPADVAAVNIDNDTAGITVSPISGLVTTELGGTASFTVVLDSQPTGNVIINISSSDTTEGTVSPEGTVSLTFFPGDWSTPQTVIVTGVDDAVLDRGVPYTIITAAAVSDDPAYDPDGAGPLVGLNPADVSVVNLDNEAAIFVTIEDFEDRNLTEYTLLGDPGATITKQAKHDGGWGLRDATAEGWMYRADLAAKVQQGEILSWWARRETLTGRAYMGFGATASGTYSIVMAPNTGALIIQKHAGYGFADLASVAQTWQANHWYRLEVAWQVGGTIIGRLYDSDGVTQLNTVIASDNTITSGGIAFRAFDGNTLFDTVQRVVAAGASSRSQSTIQQSTVVDAAILALVPPPFADSQPAADKDGLAVLNTRQAGTSPAMLPPTPSAASGLSEPGLKKNRAALVDLAITGLEEDLLENWLIDDLAALP